MVETLSPPIELRRRAESLAAGYPALLAKAERVAAVVAQGVHGRRRPGQGETFWQYRNYHQSDQANHIDWRRSARGDQVYVRENEWEAANTVYFWRDGNPGMNWRSKDKFPIKQDRASVICMALASLLMRAGERCAVLNETDRPRSGRKGLERIARRIATSHGPIENLDGDIPAHARIVIASDFLEKPDIWADRLARFSARPASGILLRIIDPAEHQFPFRGRLRMEFPGLSKLSPILIGRAEKSRDEYKARFAAHSDALNSISRRLGWPLITHYTDTRPNMALTALYAAMSGESL